MWDLEYQETMENGGKWKPIVASSDEKWVAQDFKYKITNAITYTQNTHVIIR